MASRAGATAWHARLPVADFGALSGDGVFDEIDISASLAKRGVSVCAATAGSTNFRYRPKAIADTRPSPRCCHNMMLPQSRSLRGIVQRRPSHQSNYLTLVLPSPAPFGVLMSRSI